jgi:transposase
MAKLRREQVMIASEMVARAVSVRRVATQLGVDESTLRYRLRRPADAPDGRRERTTALAGWDERVDGVLARFSDARAVAGGTGHCETQMLHGILVRQFGFTGSYQAVRRYLQRRFPPMQQAIRRVETPPGVQAQHDWFDFPAHIGGERCVLHGLLGTLSHSRGRFVWISPHMTQLAWQTGHLALFQRYEGVPLWIRIDNLKTAVAHGAGPTAVLTPAFTTFARECGFAVDPCRAAMGSDKGKVERMVRSARSAWADLLVQAWPSVEQLQAALDQRAAERHARERCPVTGTTIAVALAAERVLLQPVPGLHEPFDCVVARRVTRDALVSFESRRYSVPFAWIDRVVEVRGTAQHVVMLAEGVEIARHHRHTAARLVLLPAHYDGPSTASVRAPTPLGRRARAQLAALPGSAQLARPLADYIAMLDATCRAGVTQ